MFQLSGLYCSMASCMTHAGCSVDAIRPKLRDLRRLGSQGCPMLPKQVPVAQIPCGLGGYTF